MNIRRNLILFALAGTLSLARSATHDLLGPEWQRSWLISDGKTVPNTTQDERHNSKFVIDFDKKSNRMTVSRPGQEFTPMVLAMHFGKSGPLSLKDAPPEVALEKVGDTLGMRVVLSYNEPALPEPKGITLRLAFANSNGTRQSNHFKTSHSSHDDDIGWCVAFGQCETADLLHNRPPKSKEDYRGYLVSSSRGATKFVSLPLTKTDEYVKADKPFEAVFSFTRTGPTEVRIYCFIAGRESETVIPKATNFTFDTLYLHYPHPTPGAGASLTIREFQLTTP